MRLETEGKVEGSDFAETHGGHKVGDRCQPQEEGLFSWIGEKREERRVNRFLQSESLKKLREKLQKFEGQNLLKATPGVFEYLSPDPYGKDEKGVVFLLGFWQESIHQEKGCQEPLEKDESEDYGLITELRPGKKVIAWIHGGRKGVLAEKPQVSFLKGIIKINSWTHSVIIRPDLIALAYFHEGFYSVPGIPNFPVIRGVESQTDIFSCFTKIDQLSFNLEI